MNSKKNKINAKNSERDFAKLSKLLNSKNFESEEELNDFLNSIIGKSIDEIIPDDLEITEEEKACELVYSAYRQNKKQGKKLIEQALEIDSLCADAYLYLAETETDIHKKLKFYEKAMLVAEERLGKTIFEEERGHFWLIVETRPFMKAKAGVAECLFFLGRAEESIQHYFELLELNENDNQGVRYHLSLLLLIEDKLDDFNKIFKKYDDDGSALWLFTKALYYFKLEGDSILANKALTEAIKSNKFVLPYLLNKKKIPLEKPPYFSFGDKSEAIDCIHSIYPVWQFTPGATKWLHDFSIKNNIKF